MHGFVVQILICTHTHWLDWAENDPVFEVQIELRREAKHLAQEYKERNRQALLNVLADGTTATLGFAILLQPTEAREHFFRTASRFASGLSDTAKAFLIIAGRYMLLSLLQSFT